MQVEVQHFIDSTTRSVTYVVTDFLMNSAAIIDPFLGYDTQTGRIDTDIPDRIIERVRDAGMTVDWILETHTHEDHLSASRYLRSKLGGWIGLGHAIGDVQRHYTSRFELAPLVTDDLEVDRLFVDGEVFQVGNLLGRVVQTPGHTADSVSYLIGGVAFIGDVVLTPGEGTGRCDMSDGSAQTLYQSIQELLSWPSYYRLYVGHRHDADVDSCPYFHISDMRTRNVDLCGVSCERDFVELRTTKDRALEPPELWPTAVLHNIHAVDLLAETTTNAKTLTELSQQAS